MVSLTNNTPATTLDSLTLNTANSAAGANSTDSTNSFSQQLLSALESFLNQSGSGSQIQMTIQQEPGQNSDGSQYLVTLTSPATASSNTATGTTQASATPASASPAAVTQSSTAALPAGGGIAGDPGMPITTLDSQIQDMEQQWSSLTPSQVAFQLANAAGTGGGDPTATVPGTTMTFGDLNQTQQLAYQYGTDYGTGSMSMQDFLQANSGPATAWNLSYNQIQGNSEIQAAVDPAYQQVAAAGGPLQAPNEYGTAPATSGNADNLPNPALIPYLPADQQAAAWAALSAAGDYGSSTASAAAAYAQGFTTA